MIATETISRNANIENHIKSISKMGLETIQENDPNVLEYFLNKGNSFINDIHAAQTDKSFQSAYPDFNPKIFKMQTEDLSQYLTKQPENSKKSKETKNVIDQLRDSKISSRGRERFTLSIQDKIQEAFKFLDRISKYHFSKPIVEDA